MRNIIELLINENGECVITNVAVFFCKELYEEDELHRPLYSHRDCFPAIDHCIADEIRAQFSSKEVNDALFSMKSWKAQGIDEFQAGFFKKKHWDVVGADVCANILGILGWNDGWQNKQNDDLSHPEGGSPNTHNPISTYFSLQCDL